MNPMERRVRRLEAAMMPKPAEAITILVEPKEHAAAEDLASYAVDLAAAKASGVRIIVVREGMRYGSSQREQDGVEYSPTLVGAWMTAASCMPSERGNASRLADMLQDCSGTALAPVSLRAG